MLLLHRHTLKHITLCCIIFHSVIIHNSFLLNEKGHDHCFTLRLYGRGAIFEPHEHEDDEVAAELKRLVLLLLTVVTVIERKDCVCWCDVINKRIVTIIITLLLLIPSGITHAHKTKHNNKKQPFQSSAFFFNSFLFFWACCRCRFVVVFRLTFHTHSHPPIHPPTHSLMNDSLKIWESCAEGRFVSEYMYPTVSVNMNDWNNNMMVGVGLKVEWIWVQ